MKKGNKFDKAKNKNSLNISSPKQVQPTVAVDTIKITGQHNSKLTTPGALKRPSQSENFHESVPNFSKSNKEIRNKGNKLSNTTRMAINKTKKTVSADAKLETLSSKLDQPKSNADSSATPVSSNGQVKKKKFHKKKAKTDGLSNWKKLCTDTLHIDPIVRKTQPQKRQLETTEAVSEPKKPKTEIWFDNVDEIFLEQPASSENTSKEGGPKERDADVTDKLVKADSYMGLTNCVAMDCEMVGIGPTGEESILARVSIVNHYGVCLYDKFVLPREEVTDYRTFVSGITEENLATGEEFTKVQKEVSEIIKGRILVGHAVHNDLKVLFLTHPHSDIRDTSKYKPFRELFGGRIPSLKKLSDRLLNVQVQEGQHSSVQDAQATMRLYTMFRQRWEKELKGKIKLAKKKNTKKKKKVKKLEASTS